MSYSFSINIKGPIFVPNLFCFDFRSKFILHPLATVNILGSFGDLSIPKNVQLVKK